MLLISSISAVVAGHERHTESSTVTVHMPVARIVSLAEVQNFGLGSDVHHLDAQAGEMEWWRGKII